MCRCIVARSFFVFGLVFLVLSVSSPEVHANVFKDVAKAVLDRVLKTARKPGTVNRMSWNEHMATAMRELTTADGELAFFTTEHVVVKHVREKLATPDEAIAYIERVGLTRELQAGWRSSLEAYLADPAAGVLGELAIFRWRYSDLFQPQLEAVTSYRHLDRFYRDQVTHLLQFVREELPHIDSALRTSRLKAVLERVETFFSVESGRTTWGKWNRLAYDDNVNEFMMQSMERLIDDFSQELDFILTWQRRMSMGDIHYIQGLKELFRLVRVSQKWIWKRRVLGGAELESMGLVTDFLMAQIRYANIETKRLAYQILVDNSQWSHLLRDGVLTDILSVPSAKFRRYVIDSTVAGLKAGGRPIPAEMPVALDVLCRDAVKYLPGEARFAEAIEGMVALLSFYEEQMGRALVNPIRTETERLGILKGLSLLDSEYALTALVRAYWEEPFRQMLLKSPMLLERYLKTVAEMVSPFHPVLVRYKRLALVIKFFGAVLKEGADLGSIECERQVIRSMGDALASLYDKQIVDMLLVRLQETTFPEVAADVISALGKMHIPHDIKPIIRPYLSAANPEVRVSAALMLRDAVEAGPILENVVRENASEVSDYFLLRAVGYIRDDGLLLKVYQESDSFAVRFETLRLVAKKQNQRAAYEFFQLYKTASPSEQSRIIVQVLTHFNRAEDAVIIQKAFERVMELYANPAIEFDLFGLTGDFFVRSRLKRLSGNARSRDLFEGVARQANSEIPVTEFLSVALEVVR